MRQWSNARAQLEVGQAALDQRALAVGAAVGLGVRQRHVADGVLRQPAGVGQLVQPALVEDRVPAGVELAQPAARQRRLGGHLGALPVAERERDLHAPLVGQQAEVLAHRVEVGGLRPPGRWRPCRCRAPRPTTARTPSAPSSAHHAARPAAPHAARRRARRRSPGPPISAPEAHGVAAHRRVHHQRERRAQRVEHRRRSAACARDRGRTISAAHREQRDRQVGGERERRVAALGEGDAEQDRRDQPGGGQRERRRGA